MTAFDGMGVLAMSPMNVNRAARMPQSRFYEVMRQIHWHPTCGEPAQIVIQVARGYAVEASQLLLPATVVGVDVPIQVVTHRAINGFGVDHIQ